MKIAITGHSRGIGHSLYHHFTAQGHHLLGFSRSQGYDIALGDHRQRIVAESLDCDLFINNAHHDQGQLELLTLIYHAWLGQDRRIINVSSRITDWPWNPKETSIQYWTAKLKQDQFCQGKRSWPQIINLRPGITDTDRVKHIVRHKMQAEQVTAMVEFALASPVRITGMTFGL